MQFQVLRDKIEDSFYKLTSQTDQIRSYVFDVVRSTVPKMDLDDVFTSKEVRCRRVLLASHGRGAAGVTRAYGLCSLHQGDNTKLTCGCLATARAPVITQGWVRRAGDCAGRKGAAHQGAAQHRAC